MRIDMHTHYEQFLKLTVRLGYGLAFWVFLGDRL